MFTQLLLPLVMSAVAALPPHPLDQVFQKNNEKQVITAMEEIAIVQGSGRGSVESQGGSCQRAKRKTWFCRTRPRPNSSPNVP